MGITALKQAGSAVLMLDKDASSLGGFGVCSRSTSFSKDLDILGWKEPHIYAYTQGIFGYSLRVEWTHSRSFKNLHGVVRPGLPRSRQAADSQLHRQYKFGE